MQLNVALELVRDMKLHIKQRNGTVIREAHIVQLVSTACVPTSVDVGTAALSRREAFSHGVCTARSRGRSEITFLEPRRTCHIDIETSSPKALCQGFAGWSLVREAQNMASCYIAEGAQRPKLDQNGPLRITPHRHAGLKKNVRPRLAGGLCLGVRIAVRVLRPQVGDIVWSQEDDDSLALLECCIEHLAYVRRPLPRRRDRLVPLDGLQGERTKKRKHCVPGGQVPTMDNEHLCWHGRRLTRATDIARRVKTLVRRSVRLARCYSIAL